MQWESIEENNFIQQIFTEYLLYARHCLQPLRYGSEQNRVPITGRVGVCKFGKSAGSILISLCPRDVDTHCSVRAIATQIQVLALLVYVANIWLQLPLYTALLLYNKTFDQEGDSVA